MAESLKKYSKKDDLKKKIGFIIGAVILVIAIVISSIVIFQKVYYTPFWVNGQSMYPTLNKDAKYSDNDALIGERVDSSSRPMYDLDYGFMSTSNISINNINRFDIIVLKYSEAQTSYNIKRVIALPGETFYINSSIDDNNGNLNIFDKNKNEYVVVDQPIDSYHLKNGMYPNKYSSPITLENDEYFVMGDNRLSGNSMDSRSVGPIKRNLILGVAKGLNGKASVIYDNGNYEVKNVAHHFPRFF